MNVALAVRTQRSHTVLFGQLVQWNDVVPVEPDGATVNEVKEATEHSATLLLLLQVQNRLLAVHRRDVAEQRCKHLALHAENHPVCVEHVLAVVDIDDDVTVRLVVEERLEGLCRLDLLAAVAETGCIVLHPVGGSGRVRVVLPLAGGTEAFHSLRPAAFYSPVMRVRPPQPQTTVSEGVAS